MYKVLLPSKITKPPGQNTLPPGQKNDTRTKSSELNSINNTSEAPVREEVTYEPCDTEGNPVKKKVSKRKSSSKKRLTPKTKEAKEVNQIIGVFNHNKLGDWIYKDVKERGATKYLLKRIPYEQLKRTCEYALSIQGVDYAPAITRPSELKYKLDKLIAYKKKESPQKFKSASPKYKTADELIQSNS